MYSNSIGQPTPRTINTRSPYGLDSQSAAVGGGVPSPSAPRTTFPTRTQPPAIERQPAPAIADEPASLRPPKGTDPELWKVLTADERAFFAREEAMGPLSYGHRIASAPSMPARGGRLNLRG